MRRGPAVATALAVAGGLLVPAPPAASTAREMVRLDGVVVRLRAGTTQVVTVNHTRGHHARVTSWRLDLPRQRWRKVHRTRDGRIGYGGLVAPRHRRQGTGTTPLGTVRLLWAFGTHRPRASWDLAYRRTRPRDYWVEDNASRFYNRFRNRGQGGFRWRLPVSAENGSERLRAYPRQYELSVVTGYNYAHPVRHRGAGIFLHVNGRGATAGCVSVPRWLMVDLMRELEPSARPVLAVGR